MAKWGRRDFLKGAAAAGAAAAAPALASDELIHLERHEIPLPGLDPAHDGLRVAHLSDIHVGSLTPVERIRAAVAEANGFRPDLVALTGDYLTRDRKGVGLILEQLGGIEGPAFATLGNHDRWVDPRGAGAALEHLGYGVLENENTTLTLRGAPFTVVGIDDLCSRSADPLHAVAGAARGSRLYLAHVPRTAEMLQPFDEPLLVLSGHTHGGQVNIPLLMPALRWLAHEPYQAGLYHLGQVQLYVNRGVGNVGLPLRVNAPPEVALLTLRSLPPAPSPG
ncbi:MAG TPA: metallophosphoesterase [Anaeromyxobacteraceae bacterium]|nr:metallophosphoesterase [Anaeromyxobacteraceae bacterium]